MIDDGSDNESGEPDSGENGDDTGVDANEGFGEDFDDFKVGVEDEDFGDFDEGFQQSSVPEEGSEDTELPPPPVQIPSESTSPYVSMINAIPQQRNIVQRI